MSTANTEAARRLLAYIDKQLDKLGGGKKPTQDQLDTYIDANWDKIIDASSKKNEIPRAELIDAIIDVL